MSDEQPKIKIVIPPQVLAQMELDMTPEEIEQLIAQVNQAVEDGTIFNESRPMSLEAMSADDPELHAEMLAVMKRDGFDDFDHWIEWSIAQKPTLN